MLAGENYAPEPGFLRTADAQERRRFEEEFKKNFDSTIGRELSPRERQLRERADYFLNLHKQEEAQEAADKAQRLAAQKARQDAERQQEERRQKRAQFEFNEALIDREISDLTDEEKRQLGDKLGQRITDLDSVKIGAEEIRINRRK